MSFRLLSIGSMYPGSLGSFYLKHPESKNLSYEDHKRLLLDNTTEFIGSYVRNFRKIGVDADCIVANDQQLTRKWCMEHDFKSDDHRLVLSAMVKDCKPDVLWIEDLNYTNSAWLKEIRNEVRCIKLVIAYHCSPFNKRVLESLKGIDFIITCTPGLKTEIENLGKRSFLVYHAFDKDLLSEIDQSKNDFTEDLVFSGSLISGGDFHGNRIKLIESIIKENIPIGLYVNLDKNYRIRSKQVIWFVSELLRKMKFQHVIERNSIFAYGKTWTDSYSSALMKCKKEPVFGIDMYNLFNHSRIVLNYHIGVAGDYAGNMRLFEVTGIGSCLLTDNKRNIKDLFDPASEIVVYDNKEDCINKTKWLLEHEEERKKIALNGRKKTLEHHTVEKRCNLIADIINSELKNL